ncbi:MAG: signal peptide peptidase SppA [Phycisphaerae bacterium]
MSSLLKTLFVTLLTGSLLVGGASVAPVAFAEVAQEQARTPDAPPVGDKPADPDDGREPTRPDLPDPVEDAAEDAADALEAEFPSPAELIKRMKQKQDERKQLLQVAHFDLTEPLAEKPADFSFFEIDQPLTARDLINRMREARQDEEVEAVLITLGAGAGVSLAQAQELREAMQALREADKRVFIYADTYDTVSYVLATGASDIALLEGGEIFIPGIGLETMFYAGMFQKVGVHADYVQVGEYKGAQEPFTRTEPTEELRGELDRLAHGLYEQVVTTISEARALEPAEVRTMIDGVMLGGVAAKERGFVDHLLDQDGLRGLMEDQLGREVDLLSDYGSPDAPKLDFSNPFAMLSSLNQPKEEETGPAVALIYAEGTIVDGSGEAGLLAQGSSVGSESMREIFRKALRDDRVKAVVIRIDSPGGSALASEVMWQAARRVAEEKPVIISIGGMAASGGYYLASAGEYIFADPVAIVGSIGVVGGKFVLSDLYGKLGLTTTSFTKGQNADLFSSSERFDEKQQDLVRRWMQRTYDQFTDRIMTTRGQKITDIDKVARGRIFLAADAVELGMIDELGGLNAALAHAAERGGLDPEDFRVQLMPEPKTLADLIRGEEIGATMPFRPTVQAAALGQALPPILALLPQAERELLQRQLTLAQLLQRRPVVLMSPYAITTR